MAKENTITKIQKELTKTIAARDSAYKKLTEKYDEKITALVKSLQGNCDHSQTRDFQWEHDNGYGTQTLMPGKQCIFCLWQNLWPNSSNYFADPKTLFN